MPPAGYITAGSGSDEASSLPSPRRGAGSRTAHPYKATGEKRTLHIPPPPEAATEAESEPGFQPPLPAMSRLSSFPTNSVRRVGEKTGI